MNTMKRRAKLVIGTGVLAAAAFPGPADAATGVVPNNFYCSAWTGLCRQQNGAYKAGYPNACHRVFSWYRSGTRSTICTYWY